MNIIENLIFGAGFEVVDIPRKVQFDDLRMKFFKKLSECSEDDLEIDQIRTSFCMKSNEDINATMVSLLSFKEASVEVAEAFTPIIEEVAQGTDIFLQRRANFIVNIPGAGKRHQWPHYELMSGISPFTFVIWAPFHDLEDDGGIFYLSDQESYEFIKIEEQRGLVNSPWMFDKLGERMPVRMSYGQAIIFNPFVLHGNIEYYSSMARFAVSIRFQSSKLPLMQRNSDFFKYYSLGDHDHVTHNA